MGNLSNTEILERLVENLIRNIKSLERSPERELTGKVAMDCIRLKYKKILTLVVK